MQLRFLTSVSGNDFAFTEGQVISPTAMDARLLGFLNAGICEAVRTEPERAIVGPRERAVTVRATGKRQKRASPAPPGVVPPRSRPVVPKLIASGLAFCLGGGPSLTQADVDLCRGKGPVVAINDAYRLAPWADVLYAADQQWWKWHDGVPSFTGLRYSLQAAAAAYDVSVLENTGPRGIERAPTGLRTGDNGGYQALNLAVHLGATRIVLLGYDMQRTDNKSHWFGEHPGGGQSPYGSFIAAFDALAASGELAAVGVEVVNCSRQTALTCFPCRPLEDVLAEAS
jgi:hypothetical protein